MYWVGCSQIYTMAAISLERFIIIFKPLSLKSITFKMSFVVMAICTFLGGFMASAPLFGWSYYSLEGSLTSCSVEWAERSTNVISYNIFIFCVSFCIPVCIIIPSNLKLLFIVSHFFFGICRLLTAHLLSLCTNKVKNIAKYSANKADDEAGKKRDAKEKSLTIVMMVYIGMSVCLY